MRKGMTIIGARNRNLNRQTEYDILRVLLTILVVIGHGSYYAINTNYGGIHYITLMEEASVSDTMFHNLADCLKDWIYLFHMPAYFCLSGAIFDLEIKNRKYNSLSSLIIVKVKRIVLPMLFVWLIWNLPIKMATGYYSEVENSILIVITQIVFSQKVYLWFLQALFFIFVMDYLLILNVKGWIKQFLICFALGLLGLLVVIKNESIVPFGNPFRYLIWFWLGHYIGTIINRIHNTFANFHVKDVSRLILETLAFLCICILGWKIPIGRWSFRNTMLPFVGTIWIWEIAIFANNQIGTIWKQRVIKASSYTYGVYLWAEPLNYLVLYLFLNICGIEFFGGELGSALIYFVRIILTPIPAIFITRILRMIKFPVKAY